MLHRPGGRRPDIGDFRIRSVKPVKRPPPATSSPSLKDYANSD